MKLFKYGLPFAALALLASCSNDNIETPDAPEQTPVEAEGTAYLKLNISMPRSVSSREDPTYDDGDGSIDLDDTTSGYNEYGVLDAKLYLFNYEEGQSIGSCAVVLDLSNQFEAGSNDITSKATSTKVKLPSDFNVETNYKALVIINSDALSSIPVKGTVYGGANNWELTPQDKYTCESGNVTYFAMTNALGWLNDEVPNTGTETFLPYALPTVKPGHFYYESEDEATLGAVEIYVQRLAAKVTLDDDSNVNFEENYKVLDEDDEETGDEVILENWWLNVVNTVTYPVQQLGSWYAPTGGKKTVISDWTKLTNNYPIDRFVGNGGSGFNRVFWGEDPNYTGTSSDIDGTILTAPQTPNDIETALYCMENTMAVSDMKRDRSTTAYFKAKYFLNSSTETTDFIMYNGKIFTDFTEEDLASGHPEKSANAEIDDILTGDALTKACKFFGISPESNTKVDYYVDGECYYIAVLRHFDDELLSDGSGSGSFNASDWTNKTGYPTDDDAHFLGRYGVVRNNWYELTLNSVSGPGSPVPPTPDDKDDDDPDPKVLDATVNILQWAKRKQQVDW